MGRPADVTSDAGNSDSVRPILNPLVSNGNHDGHSLRVGQRRYPCSCSTGCRGGVNGVRRSVLFESGDPDIRGRCDRGSFGERSWERLFLLVLLLFQDLLQILLLFLPNILKFLPLSGGQNWFHFCI